MRAAETADIDGLQAAGPAVVFHLQPAGALQRLRHVESPPETLRGNRIGGHGDPVHRHPCRRERIRNLLPGNRAGGQYDEGCYEWNQRITS